MNSAPVLDVPATADLARPEPSVTKKEPQPEQAFDDVLANLDPAEPTPVEPEKKDDQVAACALGLVSFCPPPPPPPPPTEASKEVEEKKVELPPILNEKSELPPMVELPPTPEISKPLADVVRPNSLKTAKAKKPESKEIELDPKIFEPIKDGAMVVPQKPLNTASSHAGTVVAQLEKQMKNVEKTAEIAPPIEQKMPVRDVSRRSSAEIARLEPASFISNSEFSAKIDFSAGQVSEAAPAKSLEAAHLVESIRTEVASFRHGPDATINVVLKPQSGGELMLNLSVAHDGAIHVQAHCDRTNFQSLNAQWPQLQQALGAQGIRMSDLSNTGQSHQHSTGQNSSQSFSREQNPQQPRRDQDAPSFEEEMAGTPSRLAGNKTAFQPGRPASRRSWQSWA
jgi:hypothetical protein